MSLAIASQNEELVTMLIPTAKADELNSALALACQLGIVHTVKCLLNQHVDVNSTLPDSGKVVSVVSCFSWQLESVAVSLK